MTDDSFAPPRLVSILLKLGRSGSRAISISDARVLARYVSPCPGPDFWTSPMNSMLPDEKIAYFKGALLAERDHEWSCGSVAAVIWIDARLRHDRIPSSDHERRDLAEWARTNRAAHSHFRP